MALVLLSTLLCAGGAKGQIAQPQPMFNGRDDHDAITGVYLPTDRSLSRAVSRARQRLADKEYHEALAFLHGLMGQAEDSFIDSSADDRMQLGLKATARKMVGDLPSDGLAAYELLQGPTARRQLEAALKEGDRDGIARVVRQFFHTSAGYEATLVLAQMEADQGHRLAAAQLFQDLIDTPRASARFDPQLSVAAAVNQLAAGRAEDAEATIRRLMDRSPGAEVSFFGKKAALPSAGSDPLAWLAGMVGEVKSVNKSDINWLTARGDPSRNIECPGGQPHLRPRWEARVVNEPSIEAYLTSRSNDYLQRGAVRIPGARPIAVGDVVVMRTPENVVAIDWQSGKRVWETRDEQELETEDVPADLAPGLDQDQLAAQSKPLVQRMWDDALASALSSDGERVFVVRGLPATREVESFPWQINPGFGRISIESSAASNQLAAYDLATEGKLAWEVDGGRTVGPLAGAFFLGAPLPIDNTLYVMAEIRSALYLLALEPATGRLHWQQQLVGLEQGILLDVARRRVGASPSYSGGILVCPTGASAVVAIDVVKREFAWVYRYAREARSAAEARQLWQRQQLQAQLVGTNEQWLDGSAVIADNRVLITPPESSEIHCLELQTGKFVWKRRRGEALFVGGVDRGIVLLVGSQNVQGLRLMDQGAPAWKQETVALPTGVLPAGQGYLSEGRYLLPLTSGQIAEIEMETGKITLVEPASPDIVLGNLICYRGTILSQSPLVIDKFEQLEVLEKRTGTALAKNSDDTTALRESAEIKVAAGEKSEAIRLLKRALELAPEDTATQEMLVGLMLEQLASNYGANRTETSFIAKLVRGRQQQIELLQIDAAGLDALDEKLDAWGAYLRLADFTADEPAYLRIDDEHTARSDRWIASRLAAIWERSSSDEQRRLSESLKERRPDPKNAQTTAELRHYLAHLGDLPGADEVRLALARLLVERDRPQEAELELFQLVNPPSSEESRTIAAELIAKLAAKSHRASRGAPSNWPRGKVEAALTTIAQAPDMDRQARMPVAQQNGYRALRIEQDYWPGGANVQWYVAADCSEIVGRNLLGEDVFHVTIDQGELPRQYRDAALIHGKQLGHLLFVSAGGRIMAIDSRQDSPNSEGEMLWPSRAADDLSSDAIPRRRGPAAANARTSRPPVYHARSSRKRISGASGNAGGCLGPVTPRGVVFQDSNEVKCVDPLSGNTLWVRSDLPPGCELFGDDEYVFAADVGNQKAYVIRLSDGALVEKRDVPRIEWLLTSGRNLAQCGYAVSRGTRVPQITVTDMWSRKTLYRGEFSQSAGISVIEPNAVAVYEPTGTFRVIDIETGRMLVDQKLEPLSDLYMIHTNRDGDELFLFVTSQAQQHYKSIGLPADFPIINGFVYAFSLKTGDPLWPGPALVRNRGVVLQQPRDIPFLVFADRQMPRDPASGVSHLRLLCLDRRTGQTIYRNDALPDTMAARFRIRGQSDSHPAVAIDMATGKIELAMTDRPRPPSPPANDDLEAPRAIVERGLRGLGQRMGDALRGALDKPVPIQARRPPQAPAANPPAQPQPAVPNKAPAEPAVPPAKSDDPKKE
jgi:outer membrane protein assembly factor BamB